MRLLAQTSAFPDISLESDCRQVSSWQLLAEKLFFELNHLEIRDRDTR
ncbi:hypothetical protein [Neosynechococcus sphagnicola]|nr:hypothetical protein [Neosynechococcus sphagnicola]